MTTSTCCSMTVLFTPCAQPDNWKHIANYTEQTWAKWFISFQTQITVEVLATAFKDCTLFYTFLWKDPLNQTPIFPEVPRIVSTICVQLSLLSSKIHNVSLWQPFLPVQMVWEKANPTLGNGMLKTRTGASSYTPGRKRFFLANISKHVNLCFNWAFAKLRPLGLFLFAQTLHLIGMNLRFLWTGSFLTPWFW